MIHAPRVVALTFQHTDNAQGDGLEADVLADSFVFLTFTEEFLNEALDELGLNETEASDFMSYWLPLMEGNEYNVITFQTTAYEDAAGLLVTPAPDVTVRINMLWYESSEYVEMEPQELEGMNPALNDREGFTLVEWGGEMITP